MQSCWMLWRIFNTNLCLMLLTTLKWKIKQGTKREHKWYKVNKNKVVWEFRGDKESLNWRSGKISGRGDRVFPRP